jgi:putative transposase
MAYVPRDERPGYHHVVTRGNNQRRIFEDDHDRWFFCTTVERIAKKYGWTILAYCLMDNHYHLVLTVGERGLSDGMCELNTGCALNYNARHGRINHLFGKRYWNRYLTTHATVVNTLRYVVQNPRRAGGSRALEAYVWSSYAATIGVAYARIRLDRDQVLQFFGRSQKRAIEEYRAYCAALPFGNQVRWQPP